MGVRPEIYGIVHNEAFDLSFTSVLSRSNLSEASRVAEQNLFIGQNKV